MTHIQSLAASWLNTVARFRGVAAVLAASVLFSGCGAINHGLYATTGGVLKSYSKQHAVPYLMGTDDLAMGCAMAESLSPLLLSFGRVTDDPDQLAVALYLSAGSCADAQAREYGLEAAAAMRNMNAEAAQDAMIREKRAYRLAAERYFKGWQRLNTYYDHIGEGECPDLDDDVDGFIYFAGLLSGLQALNAEIQSTSSIGVPKNVGAIAARASDCLDNEKWWGAPVALKATVWAMIPGAEPEGEDAFERLRASDRLAEESGVRLAHVFHAIAAQNKGRTQLLKDLIRNHAETIKEKPASGDWAFVDAMATEIMVSMSDMLWVENTGHRTPMGQFGTFWDDPEDEVETMDLDSIL
jgi:hypothetical protein